MCKKRRTSNKSWVKKAATQVQNKKGKGRVKCKKQVKLCDQWRTGGGGCSTPLPPEIPKALENRAKLNPIVKTVKNCWI